MNFFSNGYVQIAFSSVVVYLFIVIAVRVFGKKEFSQLSVVDLVFILLISNAVQNAMVGPNTTLAGGLVAAGALFVTNFVFKQVLYRFPRIGRLLQGEALMLIYEGRLNKRNVTRARLTMDEIMEALREHGVSRVEDVNLAVLEIDGNISVLSDDYKTRTRRQRKSRQSLSQNQG
ncbi:DUF421 domain-containing protein [Sporobacter termitidis]|nr:YetF domain-containing protein [Sporobacter termitidis]